MPKKFNHLQVTKKLRGIQGITVGAKMIKVEKQPGQKVWGMIDFLKNHCGYRVIVDLG